MAVHTTIRSLFGAFSGTDAAGVDGVPTPTPTGPPAEIVTPGFAGFFVIVLLVVALVLLVWDMQRRIRRARYRSEIGEQLDAEAAGETGATADPRRPDASPEGRADGAARTDRTDAG